MNRTRTATVLSPLDERIALPVVRWLRVTHDVGRVDRISVPRWVWCEAAGSLAAREQLRRRLRASMAVHAPAVVAVVGHPFDADAGDATAVGRHRVMRITQFLRTCTETPVVGFWVSDRWAPGFIVERDACDPAAVAAASAAGGPVAPRPLPVRAEPVAALLSADPVADAYLRLAGGG